MAALARLRKAVGLPSPQNAISGNAALKRLMEGNARYVANKPNARDFAAGRGALAQAQYPIASILSCADSRVAPELLFDQNPGDLFVVRIAGNYLNADALSSLEFGVAVLGTPLLVVLGHSGCGAIAATIEQIQHPGPLPGNIADITRAVRPGIESTVKAGGDKLLERSIDANVAYNVKRVASAKPILADAVKAGTLHVVGAEYELATGVVHLQGS
jgi:carbonic anhydrase